MFISRMFNIIKNIYRFLATCHICVGKHPVNVSTPAIIFFPVMTSQFNCGFAGLMTFHSNNKAEAFNADFTLAELWKKIKISGLKKTLSGKIAAKEYLHGLNVGTEGRKWAGIYFLPNRKV